MTLRSTLGWLVASACFALSCYSSFSADSFSRRMLSDFIYRPETSLRAPYARINILFESLAGDGNIFVRFRDFKPHNPRHTAFMTELYFRGSYVAYPARVYVSKVREIINNGRDIGRVKQDLDPKLAEQLDIANLILFEFDDRTGNLSSRTIRIPK